MGSVVSAGLLLVGCVLSAGIRAKRSWRGDWKYHKPNRESQVSSQERKNISIFKRGPSGYWNKLINTNLNGSLKHFFLCIFQVNLAGFDADIFAYRTAKAMENRQGNNAAWLAMNE